MLMLLSFPGRKSGYMHYSYVDISATKSQPYPKTFFSFNFYFSISLFRLFNDQIFKLCLCSGSANKLYIMYAFFALFCLFCSKKIYTVICYINIFINNVILLLPIVDKIDLFCMLQCYPYKKDISIILNWNWTTWNTQFNCYWSVRF